ncbi:MAG: TolC family protein [Pyrinomonadaceae bacterium]|nr:TolC family protein [Pyrinomonadaceae bacterium]
MDRLIRNIRGFCSGSAALFAEKLCFSELRFTFGAAMPPDACGGIAATEVGKLTEKHSFSANRTAKPPKYLIGILGIVFVLCSASLAQTPTPTPDEPMPTAPSFNTPARPMPSGERIGVTTADPLSLTLDAAIDMALSNNNDIDVSRNDARIAEFGLKAARGIFDPLVNSQTFFESRTTPTASTIGGAVDGKVTQKQFYNDLGLSGFVPRFGGSYDVIFNSARTNTSNRNATLNPQFPAALVASYVQPLWRNRRIDANRRSIAIAKTNVEISDSQLQQKAITVIASVEQAYWDLVFALRNLQVQTDTLRQAHEQLESNKRLVDKGVLAPVEIMAANAQISTFEQAIYLGQESVTRAENTLKTLLLPDRASPEWSRPLTPVTPAEIDPPRIGLDVAVTEAFKNRPEIAQYEGLSVINRIDEKFYRNQAKPQIDLVGSYTSAGLAGTPNPLAAGGGANVPANLRGGYFTSLGNLLAQDFPTYRVGVQIGFPLRNRTAKANLGRVMVEGERLANNRAQVEQLIEADVRNALQTLRSAESRLVSATDARAAAEELYASEQRQFRAGTTTFYLVLQRQTELTAARGRELQARTDLNKAVSEFRRSIGTTLSANNVTVTR